MLLIGVETSYEEAVGSSSVAPPAEASAVTAKPPSPVSSAAQAKASVAKPPNKAKGSVVSEAATAGMAARSCCFSCKTACRPRRTCWAPGSQGRKAHSSYSAPCSSYFSCQEPGLRVALSSLRHLPRALWSALPLCTEAGGTSQGLERTFRKTCVSKLPLPRVLRGVGRRRLRRASRSLSETAPRTAATTALGSSRPWTRSMTRASSCSWQALPSVLTALSTSCSEMRSAERARSSESMDDDDEGGGPVQGAPEGTLYPFRYRARRTYRT